ncbi:putative NT-type C2 domain-containing protein [Helianthus annuus]|nr:putative NT-type C2 domain-containing protein [Helianthus annuus]
MKEMMKHKMMNRFHRRNSSSSSSLDFKSGEKLDFKFSSLQALQVPAGWDKLTLSLISVETDKTVTKTGKASVYNGNCRWTESLSESIWISQDDSSKELQQCLYKLLISKGSTRSGILGEVTVNLSNYFSSETSLPVALPLKKCDHGTILQVAIQCLNPRANLRSRDSNSVAEDVNSEYSDLDNMSDAPHGTNNNNVGSSSTDSVVDASPARALGSRATSSSTVRSYHSFDSMDDSFGRESSLSNLSEVTVDLIGRPESTGLVNVYDSPKSNRSGKNLLNQRQDSGKVSHIPASPLRTFHSSSEFVLEADASTPEELRAEARSWERNARKLKVDLDLSRNETINQTKHLENVTMELSALQKECNGLKDENKHLKILLGESAVKERDAVNLKNQVQDNKDIQVKLEEEIKFQKNLNDDLALQLSKTQESNLELVSVLQELEELDDTKDSHISGTKILEKKILELETHNHELEMQLAELEEENLHLSGRIAGLEPQLRYLTDDRESSRLEAEHSESQVLKLQSEIEKLESELESTKVDMRQKVQDMQKRWLEAQEECEYLRKANPKLESTTENLMEECSLLQKSNSELRQQRLELNNRCTILETKLKESQDNFMKLSKSSEDLEEKLSSMIDGIELKEKTFNSEIDGLRQKFKEHAEKCVTDENVLNKMYSDKVVEVENLKQEVEHLNRQMSATHDERDKMASEAVLEMHVLRAEKDKLVNSIAEVEEKLRLSEKKVDTIQVEYEKKILDLTVEIDSSKQNHEELVTNHEKLMELLENTRSSEEKLKNTVGELSANVKSYEYKTVQVTEENSSLKDQLQRLPVLQDEIVALKNSLNDMKFENERLSASLQMVSDDYQQLKEENISLVEKVSSMQKSMIELEDHKRNKIVLEEKILRLQGDLTAREALGAQDAELKNEVGRLKRSNSQLQWKINRLQEEKDEYLKKTEALEEQKQDLKPNEHEAISISTGSDSTEDAEVNKVDSKVQSLEVALAEALEANEMYKLQLKSFVSEGPARESDVNEEHKNEVSSLERELSELQERYLHMSLKYAEVEAQREELVLKLKAIGPGRSWFS